MTKGVARGDAVEDAVRDGVVCYAGGGGGGGAEEVVWLVVAVDVYVSGEES